MNLRFPLLATLAIFSTAVHATTLSGVGNIEPITYTLEDLDVNDGVSPQAVETAVYEPSAEFYMTGTSGAVADQQAIGYGFSFLTLNMNPAYSTLTGIYSGGDWGGFSLQANFSAASMLSGFMYHQRKIEITAKTRIRIKTKASVQGYVDSNGPALPPGAELTLSTTLSLKNFGTTVGSKFFYKTLTEAAGSVFQEEDVEFMFENNSDQPTTLVMYYDLQHNGNGAE